MMDPTDHFTNFATMDPASTITDHYTRQTHVIPASLPGPGDVSIRRGVPSRLRLAVHEYNITGAKNSGYTIILTHGTSFNKFFWELVIDHLLSTPGQKPAVERLIALDAANRGGSAVLNREVLPSKGKLQAPSNFILSFSKYVKLMMRGALRLGRALNSIRIFCR